VRDLLNRRVIGFPVEFIALCYVLSGGLPKDLLRVACTISMINSCGDSPDHPELADVAGRSSWMK
jgi:hypothetical protein